MKRLHAVSLIFVMLVASVTQAEPKSELLKESVEPSSISIVGGAGINLLSYPVGISNVDNRMPFTATLTANYFFGNVVGGFTGLQTTSRGFKTMILGTSSTAPYIDVPFGVVINASGDLKSNARPLIRAGGFYAIPAASEFKGDVNLSNIGSKTKGYFGIFLDHQTTFPIMRQLALGYSIWGKIPLSSGLDPSGANFYEAGIGVVLELR